MSARDDYLSKYDYNVPKELIAKTPSSPRDTARLLAYNRTTKEIRFDAFRNLVRFLPPHSVLVFNQTKVIPARFEVKKETGGKAVLLYLSRDKKLITVLADRKLITGSTVSLTPALRLTVDHQQGPHYFLRPLFPITRFLRLLDRYGKTPLPPYIKHPPLSERQLRREYQAVFAKTRGSVAAPTASLHFTKRLLKKLTVAGHDVRFITLHVSLGTFAPLTEENLVKSTLHTEHYSIDPATVRSLNRAKQEGRPIIAVGTTVVRALESTIISSQTRVSDCRKPSAGRSSMVSDGTSDSSGRGGAQPLAGAVDARFRNAHLSALRGPSGDSLAGGINRIFRDGQSRTNLFIRPGYRFKFIDGLITNFHVPRSSLLMLVSAFAGRETTMRLYQTAVAENFRLFSFGDGMLIL